MIKRLLFSVISMAMCLPAFCQLRGDLNTDGLVDVGDVSVLIDIVLGRDAFGTEENQHTFQVGDVSFTMVTVVGGWFVMGSRDGDQSEADDEDHSGSLHQQRWSRQIHAVLGGLVQATGAQPRPGHADQPLALHARVHEVTDLVLDHQAVLAEHGLVLSTIKAFHGGFPLRMCASIHGFRQ